MSKLKIVPTKLVRDSDGGLSKPQLGQIVNGFECNGILFETEERARAHLAHLPLRKELQSAMFEIIVNSEWFGDDEDDAIERLSESLSIAMLGIQENVDDVRTTIIRILQKDQELYHGEL